MIHYLKADLYKIFKERKLILSVSILILLSLLTAFLFKESPDADNTASVLQLLSQFITLFFIVPSNLFFGEDFSNRTINNLIIKQKQRHSLFFYKVLASLFFNISYVLLAYLFTGIFRILLGGHVDSSLIFNSFIHQLPILVCISLIAILIFVSVNRISQAYLSYILLNLLFDNVSHLILSNVLHLEISSDYFLFASLQSGSEISLITLSLSLLASLVYLFISSHVFNRKELK